MITEAGLSGLRQLAAVVHAAGHASPSCAASSIMRAELVLADLDTLAPVLQADEQAFSIVGYAA